jgi:hypothetical protein
MTIGSKLHMALTAAEGLRVQCEQFGLDTEDKQAKAQFFQLAQTIEQQVVPVLRQRVNQIEQQEPQYKVRQQAMQQAQQSGGGMGTQVQSIQQQQAQGIDAQMGGISAATAMQPSSPATTATTRPQSRRQ